MREEGREEEEEGREERGGEGEEEAADCRMDREGLL